MTGQQAFPGLGARQREILRAVIREHIATAEPVASGTLVRRYHLDVSPATVRNDLAALEAAGLLTHPHTSAGRIPTDLGYRYFIESLMADDDIPAAERLTVSHQFQQARGDATEWLRLAAATLARLTAEAALVTPPATPRARLRHVEVVPIGERRALLVAVLEGGTVRQTLLELSKPVATDALRALSAQLVDRLGGASVAAVRAFAPKAPAWAREIVEALARELDAHDATRAHDVHLDGIQNILAQPEFGQRDRLRAILGLLEDRTRLAVILPGGLNAGEVSVAIGSEHRFATLEGCSIVFGRYGDDRGVLGYVGVIGPTRMDYARSIGAVRYVGALMSDLVRVAEGN